MTNSKYILAVFIFFNGTLFAQQESIDFEPDIKALNELGVQIIGNKSDEEKAIVNKDYTAILKALIAKEGSFEYNFKSLKTISVLKAHDLKVYNWALPLGDGTYTYFAFLQIKKSKTQFDIVSLTDKSDQVKSPENKILTAKNWYGALYHKLIYNKKIGQNYYTLLGWDGNNNLSNKKIIDVINISGNGIIKFGAPIFKTEKRTKRRVIFEYTKDAIMSLKYYPKTEKIVFNQLEPISSKLKGVYEYYAPTLKYFDAFTVEKGKWVIEKNTEITNEKSIKDEIWKDPKN